jgi:hypothetical protein
MSSEVLQIALVIGGAVAGWLARHNNLLAPPPATPATPAPAPATPSNPDALWQLAWHILREKFPNLPPLDQLK